jgi:hypothetical protein
MTCKNIYMGQKWSSADLKFGKGSIYLGGPRNRRGRSWRIDVINQLSNALDATLLIPETSAQLKGGASRSSAETDRWQKFAIGSAAAIIFWYPKDAAEDSSVIDIGAWSTTNKVFFGKEPENQTATIITLAESNNVIISDSLDGLIERLTGYLNRE